MGEVPLHVRGVLPEAPRDEGSKPGPHARRILEEVKRPGPGDEPEGHLEATGPVDADPAGVARNPASKVRAEGLGKPLVSGQPVGLAEPDHPLVAVQLPDDLAVPEGLSIQRIDRAPVPHGCASAADRVEVPVDGLAEAEVPIAEEVEAATKQRLGLAQDPVTGPRGSTVEQRTDSLVPCPPEEGCDRPQRTLRGVDLVPTVEPGKVAVDPLRGLLPGPAAYLRRGHLEEAPEVHGGLAEDRC